MPTGAVSRIDVLDLDITRHREAARWLAERRIRLPLTRVHRTRSGGLHLLFRHRSGMRWWAGQPLPGIDGRGDGGYIVWWPASGEPVLCDAPIAPWPGWLIKELAPQPAERSVSPHSQTPCIADCYCAAALRNSAQRIAAAPVGTRNATLNAEAYSIARLVAAGGLDAQQAVDALAVAAIAVGLSSRETVATLLSAFGARGLA
jgi:hypothetical protein